MAGPAIDPETGEFLQPGLCPINSYTGQRECPPTTEKDCLVVEKVFDQCFKEDIIVRKFEIPAGPGDPCENVDLTRVDRVECEILSADCAVVDVSPPISDNIRIVTVRQDVEVEIELWDDTPTPVKPAPSPKQLLTFSTRYSYTFRLPECFLELPVDLSSSVR